MKRLLLAGLIVLFANASETDLLKVATNGKVNGKNYAVAQNEAKNVKAGYYGYSCWFYNSYLNPYSSYYRGTMHSYIFANAYWRYIGR